MLLTMLAAVAGGCAALGGFELPWSGGGWGARAEVTDSARAYTHYMASVVYELRGRNDKTIDALNKVAELDPAASAPSVRLVRAYLRQGDVDQALRMAERATRQAPGRVELWILLGEMYHQAKRHDDAVAAFNKAISLRPDDILGYGALVELQESTNDLVAALEIYQKMIERNPGSAALYYQLGLNLARIKDTEGGIAAFRKVLELEPRVARARFMLALLLFESNNNAEAAAQFRHYLDERPGELSTLEYIGGAAARMGRYDEALDAFRRLLESDAAQPKHYLQTAWLMLLAGRPDEAQRLAPESGAPILAGVLTVLANKALGADNVDEYAKLDLIQGDIEQECGGPLTDLLYLHGLQETGARLESMLAGLQGPGDPPSRVLGFVRSRVLINMDRHAEAVPVLEGLLSRHGGDRWIHYQMAVCQEKLKNTVAVEEHLNAFLAVDPDDPEVLNFLGFFYADNSIKLKEAEALIKKALQYDPDNPFYLDSLGWVYYRMGRGAEALDLIRRAIYGMDTDDAELRSHLGDVYLLLGEPQRAVEEWRRALRLDPKREQLREKIEEHGR